MSAPRPFLDVGSPYAYLAAERAGALLPGAVWEPVLLGGNTTVLAGGELFWGDDRLQAAAAAARGTGPTRPQPPL